MFIAFEEIEGGYIPLTSPDGTINLLTWREAKRISQNINIHIIEFDCKFIDFGED